MNINACEGGSKQCSVWSRVARCGGEHTNTNHCVQTAYLTFVFIEVLFHLLRTHIFFVLKHWMHYILTTPLEVKALHHGVGCCEAPYLLIQHTLVDTVMSLWPGVAWFPCIAGTSVGGQPCIHALSGRALRHRMHFYTAATNNFVLTGIRLEKFRVW